MRVSLRAAIRPRLSRLFGSLRGQLVLWMVLVLAVCFGTLGWLFNLAARAQFERFAQSREAADITDVQALKPKVDIPVLEHAYAQGGGDALVAQLTRLGSDERQLWLVLRADGVFWQSQRRWQVLEAKVEAGTAEFRAKLPAGTMLQQLPVSESRQLTLEEQTANLYYILLPAGVLSRSASPELKQLLLLTLLFTLATLALAALIMGYLGRRITQPLQDLARASARLGAGDYSAAATATGSDEIGQLGRAFNAMVAQLQRDQRLRKRMISDVAHELRTPLTGIRCQLEAAQDGLLELDIQQREQLLGQILQLQQLIDDLQELGLAQAGELRIQQQPIELSELLDELVGSLPELGTRLRLQLAQDLPLRGYSDPRRLRQILGNLLGNAGKFAPPPGAIELQLSRCGQNLRFAVRDYGPGVAAEDLENIFERLYRTDSARSRAVGGSGLGLAITRELVTLLGGRIWAELPDDGGLRVCFELAWTTDPETPR